MGRSKKRLQMVESVSLGEKRFVALVRVDGRQFLIGGAPSNVGMLAELTPEESFHQVLRDATQGLDIAAVAPAREEEAQLAGKSAATASRTTAEETSAAATPAPDPIVAAAIEPAATAPPAAAPTPASAPVAPVTPVDPVDLVLGEPVSLSPSLLAAIQASSAPAETPEVTRKTYATDAIPSARYAEAVSPELTETPVAKAEKIGAATEPANMHVTYRSSVFSAPQFTFQVSHLFHLGLSAVPQSAAGIL